MKKSGLIHAAPRDVTGLAPPAGSGHAAAGRTCPPRTATCCAWATLFTTRRSVCCCRRERLVKEYSHGTSRRFPPPDGRPWRPRPPGAQPMSTEVLQHGPRRLAAAGRGPAWPLPVVLPREIKALPARTQITRHTCEEGWTQSASGPPAPQHVLDAVGILRDRPVRVVFHSHDDLVDSIDLLDALHPQIDPRLRHNGATCRCAHRRSPAAGAWSGRSATRA